MQGAYYVVRTEQQRKNAADNVLSQPISPAFTVQCKPYKPPKTYPQLEKIHAMIKDVALHLGKDDRMVKIDVKSKFGVYHVYSSAIDGERQVIFKSFADYTREELSSAVQGLEVWCSENGIRLN